ncbi:hypothetical protein [Streptomyces lavendulae]|uniref:hypothetical protein n=1 Tax=Streptomyces lavendulae TaxID=1914 RepID=UPI0031EF16C1
MSASPEKTFRHAKEACDAPLKQDVIHPENAPVLWVHESPVNSPDIPGVVEPGLTLPKEFDPDQEQAG